uniref:Bifunctional inhibitor/plant lipid transfer protein/seed storage helical domain-containing protein n=1 Tax=Oryza rufipogon TaxID=4529 RepID=A0A0E0RCW2_ORYRU
MAGARRTMALVALVAVVAAAVVAERASAAVSCGDVTSSIAPCLSYVMGRESSPSSSCCSGVRTLNGKASRLQLPQEHGLLLQEPQHGQRRLHPQQMWRLRRLPHQHLRRLLQDQLITSLIISS